MSTRPFHFKQFTVHQDRCAMKIGTDGVLLGAWVDIWPTMGRILDIGTGTGLVALMLAQRCNAIIDAVEINEEAAKQSAENFAKSPWVDRLRVYETSLQDYDTDVKYDLIVSNPPYFNSAKGIATESRTLARYTGSLSLDELIAKSMELLNNQGTLALIIPYEEEDNVVDIARKNGLLPFRFCRVKGTADAKSKRVLIQFGRVVTTPQYEELVVETSRHIYSSRYVELCKDFYLAM